MPSASKATLIGEEELRGAACVIEDEANAKALLKYLKAERVRTLPKLLAYKEGALRAVGAEEKQVVKDMASAIKGDDQFRPLSKEKVEDIASEILALVGSARARADDCHKRMQKANGMEPGGKGGAACDEDSLWEMVAHQRGGRQLLESDRGSSRLLRSMWRSLTDPGGRSLPVVDLRKVTSREEVMEQEAEAGGEGEEAKKAKAKDVRSFGDFRRRVVLVFHTLACASATQLPPGGDGPVVTGRQGAITLAKSSLVLDCSLAEAQDAASFVLNAGLAKGTVAEAVAVFTSYWAEIRNAVAWNGNQRTSVAGALEHARKTHQLAKRAAEELDGGGTPKVVRVVEPDDEGGAPAPRAKARAPGKPLASPAKKRRTRKRKAGAKEGGEEEGDDEEEDAPIPRKGGGKGPTSDEVCRRWWSSRVGECPDGNTCRYRHPRDLNDKSSADIREKRK